MRKQMEVLAIICLVEWNDINKTQSWINFFALSLSNQSYANNFVCKKQQQPSKNIFHIIHYCKARVKVAKVSTRHQRILQVPGTN
jgi:hypothetical protein